MRNRNERRYLTEKYRKKQIRFWETFNPDCEITDRRGGRYKKHSWNDCGRAGCNICGNPRKTSSVPKKDRVTMQEKRAEDSFEDGLEEYFIYE